VLSPSATSGAGDCFDHAGAIDDIVAWVFSTSATAPHLFGDRQQDYERDVREIL